MADQGELHLVQISDPLEISPRIRQELIDCWVTVTNGGGAAGFPFPPVDVDHVAPVADEILHGLDPQHSRLLVATSRDVLAGWVILNRAANQLITHWGSIHHLQTHPLFRGRGIGSQLMRQVRRIARDEMGLEQLHLAVRGGQGLEDFYQRLGWREIGRWPEALRLTPRDTRDEVLMLLAPL